MNCGKCTTINDGDAVFCANCGSALRDLAEGPRRTWRSYWFALLLVPVLLAAAGMGYYKFMLPNGVAAVVNGEEITLAELDTVIRSARDGRDVPEEAIGRMRSAALSELITERVAFQEARKAGVRVSPEEMNDAIARMRSAAGLDEQSFDARVKAIYGGKGNFRKGMERQLIIRKYIDERITAGVSDPTIAGFRVNQWLQGISSKAAVRVSLEEQMQSSAGCACCGGDGTGRGPAKHGCDPKAGTSAKGKQPARQITAARDAAIGYWSKKHGNGPVETRVTDLGCHLQVDILENNRIARSLRYQNGTITEM
ncbi:MAG: SurA N-terminal domain-containing protein [Nitrospirota bacterium]